MTLDAPTLIERAERLHLDHPRLAPVFAAIFQGSPDDSRSARAAMFIDAFENEAELAASEHAAAWLASTAALEASANADPDKVPTVADTLRMKAITVVALNRAVDHLDFAALAVTVGPEPADSILALDALLFEPGLALATALVRNLGSGRPGVCASPDDQGPTVWQQPSSSKWAAAISVNAAVAAHLIADDPVVSIVAVTWGADRMADAIDHEGLDSWRLLAAAVRDDPWGSASHRLISALDSASDEGVVIAVRAAIVLIRKVQMREEQREVARLVAGYVATSGLTQRAFAARTGTSPSRLSTYVNGLVTPSAAMMLRMAKVASLPAVRQAPEPDPPELAEVTVLV